MVGKKVVVANRYLVPISNCSGVSDGDLAYLDFPGGR